jgi:hypothetical protein
MSTEEAYLAEPDHAISDAALDTIFRARAPCASGRDKPDLAGAADGDL